MFAARPWLAMRRLPVLLVLLLALAIPALGATAKAAPTGPQTAHAAKLRSCRTPFTETRTAQGIQADGVGCKAAVKVAVTVGGKAPTGCVKMGKGNQVKLAGPCVRRGFRCSARAILKGTVLKVTCRRGSALIRFQY